MLVFMLVHSVLVILAGYLHFKSKTRSISLLLTWLTFIVFPIGGPLIYWLIMIYKNKDKIEENIENSADFVREMPVFELIEPLDVKTESNIAPMEETLLVADYDKRREVILNILKEGTMNRSGFIDMALRNEDSETAHFAASGILHAKRKLDLNLSIYAEMYRNDPSDMTVAYTYADLLFQYLSTVRLDRVDRLYYQHENIHVLERIVKKGDQSRSAPMIRLIELLLDIEDYNRANQYCAELREKFPDSEEKYLTLLKSFFVMRDKTNFEQIFRKFRDSNVYFSSETMNVIRLWLESLSHVKMSADKK